MEEEVAGTATGVGRVLLTALDSAGVVAGAGAEAVRKDSFCSSWRRGSASARSSS